MTYRGCYETIVLFGLPLPDFHIVNYTPLETEYCVLHLMFFFVGIATAGFSFILQIFNLIIILKMELWKQRKYLQFAFITVTSAISAFSFSYLVMYRLFVEITQAVCILSFQIFLFGMAWNYFALLSLSLDCFVAVFWPLQFRSIMTLKQFFWFNGTSFIFLAVSLVIVPVSYFGSLNDGVLKFDCDLDRVASPEFFVYLQVLTAFMAICFIVLNFGVAVGVLKAYLTRLKMSDQKNNSSKVLIKPVIQTSVIIFFNVVLTMPISIILRITLPFSVAYCLACTSGPLNTIFFSVTDKKFREYMKKTLCCNSK